jgi:rhodanese-related sulfurtransferase
LHAQDRGRLVAVPTQIGREEVRAMAAVGVVVVEVLPAEEFEDEHLPGAINIPLKKLDAMAPERLAQDRPVIVYCYDPL